MELEKRAAETERLRSRLWDLYKSVPLLRLEEASASLGHTQGLLVVAQAGFFKEGFTCLPVSPLEDAVGRSGGL